MNIHQPADGWYRLYVVMFPNDRVKVGITRQLEPRMDYYRQEARRHGFGEIRYWESNPMPNKRAALHAEQKVCEHAVSDSRIKGHREWCHGDISVFDGVVESAEFWTESGRAGWMNHDEMRVIRHRLLENHGVVA